MASAMLDPMDRTFLLYLVVPVVLAMIVFSPLRIFFHITPTRTITTDIVQGVLAGAALSFITVLLILPNFYVTKVNGWTTMFGCGEPGRSLLARAACNVTFMGPINVNAETMYWTTRTDAAGRALSGTHDYILHFPPGASRPLMRSGRSRWAMRPIASYRTPSIAIA